VVANAVAALAEIDDMSDQDVFQITEANLSKLQAALNLCTEWGQVCCCCCCCCCFVVV
jgi:AP-1 complex subunit beta-1